MRVIHSGHVNEENVKFEEVEYIISGIKLD